MGTIVSSIAAVHFFHPELPAKFFTLILVAVTVWSLTWKGVALWFAARNYQKKWFIALLILNTLGIAEIIYLVFFRRDKQEGVTKSLFNNPLPSPEEEHIEVAGTPAT